MAVYVDMLIDYGGWFNQKFGPSCHMTADSEEELHVMAKKIGMKREWFQMSAADIPHYDLNANKRAFAVRLGAVEIDRNEAARRVSEALKLKKINHG